MKTSHLRACECKPFIHRFMIFRRTKHMDRRVEIHKSHTQYWATNILIKVKAPLQQLHHQHESVGEMEKKE